MTDQPLQQADLLIRGGSLAALCLLAGLLWFRQQAAHSAKLAAAMLVLIACHVLATMNPPIREPWPLGVAIAVGAALVPPGFWLFTRSWFNDRFAIGWLGWVAASAAFGVAAAQVLLAQLGGGAPLIVQAVVRVMMIGFTIAGLWEAWRGRGDDLVELRRRLRAGLVWTVGLFALATNAIEIAIDQKLLPGQSAIVVELGILGLCLFFSFILLDLRNHLLFAVPDVPEPKAEPVPVDEEGARRVLGHMRSMKAWRDEKYSISRLATDLGEPEYRLRRLINGQLGFRNFAAFLSSFRLEEVRSALDDPSQRDVAISTIALDAGFGSLGPFNRIFREAEGMTPSEYRARRAG